MSIENQRVDQAQSQYKDRVSFNAKNAYRDIEAGSPVDGSQPDYSDNSFSNFRMSKSNLALKPFSGANDRTMARVDSKSSL